MMQSQPRIGVIGCGAIAENFHLPALARHRELLPLMTLVDPDLGRARALAERFGVGNTCGDYKEALERVDGVIVAVPHHLHLPISLECVRAGVHVLCEKPLAETTEGVRQVVAAAEDAGVNLLVNQTRRLFPSHQEIKRRIDAGELGRLRRITYTMGEPFEWPAATGSYFGARGSRKGVLLDTGAHIIDLVCWWLGEEPELVDYLDDSHGGTEAVAHVEMRAADCTSSVRLSWLSKLGNRYCVEGEKGRIEGGAYDWGVIDVTDASGRTRKVRTSATHQSFEDFSARLIDNFLDVLRGTATPLVPGREVLASIGVIDRCYESRKSFEMPWQSPRSGQSAGPTGSGPIERVLVTGGGGFLGSRVCEVLQDRGCEVRAGLRRWGGGARIGRSPVDMALCDIMDPKSIEAALEGVTHIVHCAVGDRKTTVEGTRNMLAAAEQAGVERFVHISTIDVYGAASGEVGEDTAFGFTGKDYGDSKIEAEQACAEFIQRGLPVAILRPTLIYGPFSESWTIEWATRLQNRPWLLSSEDCQGICNLVYVDDVANAVHLALVEEAAVGEAFNVNGADRPTWQTYFEALNTALALPPLVAQSKATSHAAAAVMQPVRNFAKFLLAHFEGPIMSLYQRSALAKRAMMFAESTIKKTPTTGEFDLLTKQASFPTEKAAERLGYQPQVDMASGIEICTAWLRHHGYVRADPPL